MANLVDVSVPKARPAVAGPFRIGILTVDNDPVPESEIVRLAPLGVSVHTVRFRLARATGEIYRGGATARVEFDFGPGLATLKRIGVDAVALCFTSSSIFEPASFDAAFVQAAAVVDPHWDVVTEAGALRDCLRRTRSARPLVVVPPWFSPETVRALDDYLRSEAEAVARYVHYDLGDEWAQIPAQDRFDRGAMWAVRPDRLIDQLTASESGDRDAIVIPGSGFPSVDALTQLQDRVGVPVVSANSAVLMDLLHRRHTNSAAANEPAWYHEALNGV